MQISIHALREEGDEYLNGRFYYHQHFYPRPPRGGRRKNLALRLRRRVFLSTPSARRATAADQHRVLVRIFLSTPSARRAT